MGHVIFFHTHLQCTLLFVGVLLKCFLCLAQEEEKIRQFWKKERDSRACSDLRACGPVAFSPAHPWSASSFPAETCPGVRLQAVSWLAGKVDGRWMESGQPPTCFDGSTTNLFGRKPTSPTTPTVRYRSPSVRTGAFEVNEEVGPVDASLGSPVSRGRRRSEPGLAGFPL